MIIRLRKKEICISILLIVIVVFASTLYINNVSLTMQQLSVLSYGFLVIYLAFCLNNRKNPVLSSTMLVIHYLVATAIGVPLAYPLNPEYVTRRIYREKVFYGVYLDKYILISIIAISALLLSLILFSKEQYKRHERVNRAVLDTPNCYYQIGLILLIMFALYIIYGVLRGRIPLFNYTQFKSINDRLFGYLERGYWFGTIFVCAAGTKRKIVAAMPWFLIASALLIMAGNRNDIYFPLLLGIGIYTTRFKKVPYRLLIVVGTVILLGGPIIITLRNAGTYEMGSKTITELLSETLCELGGQVAASSHMFQWLIDGDGYGWGVPYVMGVIGSIFYPLHIGVETSIQEASYWIANRTTAIGFSMVAEVYYNFSLFGLIIVFFLLGISFARTNQKETKNLDALVRNSFLYFWLLFLVRNYFGFSFTYLIMFYAVYFAEKIVRRVMLKRRSVILTKV